MFLRLFGIATLLLSRDFAANCYAAQNHKDAVDELKRGIERRSKGKMKSLATKIAFSREWCKLRGGSDAECNATFGLCNLDFSQLCNLPKIPLLPSVYCNVVGKLYSGSFKAYCEDGTCYQCCQTARGGCQSSFIGFPVINCNEGIYGIGTRPVGLTLITEANPQPGQACLFTQQICDHIPQCAVSSSGGGNLNLPRAGARRGRFFFERAISDWDNTFNNTSGQTDFSLQDMADFVFARGCRGWRQSVEASPLVTGEFGGIAVRNADNTVNLPASELRFVQLQGFLRLLGTIPDLRERVESMGSRLWTPDGLKSALTGVADPDAVLRRSAGPVGLSLLKQNFGLVDYRLLALPTSTDNGRNYLGCELGIPPRILGVVEMD
ncbi:MAG: hypothetical protein U0R19_36480 [Bryobacteraceae bacterium]